jgi:hypothetical protein
MKRIERIIGEAILEDAQNVFVKGFGTLQVSHATTATLIEVSKIISDMDIPDITKMQEGDRVGYVLANASDFEPIADIAAVLVLGKKHIADKIKPIECGKTLFSKVRYLFCRKVSARKALGRAFLEECTPKQLQEVISTCIGTQQIGFFLSTIIFLNGVSVLKKTVKKATASGQ